MWVVMRHGDVEVELSAEGDYAPDAMVDLCNRAKELFTYQHALLGVVGDEDDEG